jgi:uncharacterized protein YceH (UPF0502 family)
VTLSSEEGRVLASLIEKQLATPQQYPLTLNSLTLACNQTSNRDPVVSYDESLVELALSSLKEAGLVRFVHPSHGRSVIRYRQVLEERLGLPDTRLALVGCLLLRGPQTAGELRGRSERMATFDGIASVEADLLYLSELPEPLAVRMARQPGQKEERWAQLLAGEPPATTSIPAATSIPGDGRRAPSDLEARVERLESEVEELRGELKELSAALGYEKAERQED